MPADSLQTLCAMCDEQSCDESQVSNAIESIIRNKVDINQWCMHRLSTVLAPLLHTVIQKYNYKILQILLAHRFELNLNLLAENIHGQTVIDLIRNETNSVHKQKLAKIFVYYLKQDLQFATDYKTHFAVLQLNYPNARMPWLSEQIDTLKSHLQLVINNDYDQLLQSPQLQEVLNVQTEDGDTLLYKVCSAKKWDVAKRLILQGAKLGEYYAKDKHPLDILTTRDEFDQDKLDFFQFVINTYPGDFIQDHPELIYKIALNQYLDGKFVPTLQDLPAYASVHNKLLLVQAEYLYVKSFSKHEKYHGLLNLKIICEMFRQVNKYMTTEHLQAIKNIPFRQLGQPNPRDEFGSIMYESIMYAEETYHEEISRLEQILASFEGYLDSIIPWEVENIPRIRHLLQNSSQVCFEIRYKQLNKICFGIGIIQDDKFYFARCKNINKDGSVCQSRVQITDMVKFRDELLSKYGLVEEIFEFEKTFIKALHCKPGVPKHIQFFIGKCDSQISTVYAAFVLKNIKSVALGLNLFVTALKLQDLEAIRRIQFLGHSVTDYESYVVGSADFDLSYGLAGTDINMQCTVIENLFQSQYASRLSKKRKYGYPFNSVSKETNQLDTFDACLIEMHSAKSIYSLPIDYDLQDDFSDYNLKIASILLGIHPREALQIIDIAKTPKRTLQELIMLYLGIDQKLIPQMSTAQIELVLLGVSKQIATCSWVTSQHVEVCEKYNIFAINQLRKLTQVNKGSSQEQLLNYPYLHQLHTDISSPVTYLNGAQQLGLSLQQIADPLFGLLQARAVAHGLTYDQAVSLTYPQLHWFLLWPQQQQYAELKQKKLTIEQVLLASKYKIISFDMLGTQDEVKNYIAEHFPFYFARFPNPKLLHFVAEVSQYPNPKLLHFVTEGSQREIKEIESVLYRNNSPQLSELNNIQKLGLLYGFSIQEVQTPEYNKHKLMATIFFGLNPGHIISLTDSQLMQLLPKDLQPLADFNAEHFVETGPFSLSIEPIDVNYTEVTPSAVLDDAMMTLPIAEIHKSVGLDDIDVKEVLEADSLLSACKNRQWQQVQHFIRLGADIFQEFPPGGSPLESIAFIDEPNSDYINLLKFLAVHCAGRYNLSFYSKYNIYYPFWGIIASTQPLTKMYVPLHSDSREYQYIYGLLRRMQLKIMLHNHFELHPGFHSLDGIWFKPTGSYGKIMRYEFLLYLRRFTQIYPERGKDGIVLELERLLCEYIPTSMSNRELLVRRIFNRGPVAFEMQVMFEQFAHNFNAFVADDLFYIADRSQGAEAIKIYEITDRAKFILEIKKVFGYRVENELLLLFFANAPLKLLQKLELPKQISFNCTFTSMDALLHVMAIYILAPYAPISERIFDIAKETINLVRNYGVYLTFAEQSLYSSPLNQNRSITGLPPLTEVIQLDDVKTYFKVCRARLLDEFYEGTTTHLRAAGIPLVTEDDFAKLQKHKLIIYDLGPRVWKILTSKKLTSDQLYAVHLGVPLELATQDWVTRVNAKYLLFYPVATVKKLTDLQLLGLRYGLSINDVQQEWLRDHHLKVVDKFKIFDINKLHKISLFQYLTANEYPEYANDIFACKHFSTCHESAFSLIMDKTEAKIAALLALPGPQALAVANELNPQYISDPRLTSLCALAINRRGLDIDECLEQGDEKLYLLANYFVNPIFLKEKRDVPRALVYFILTMLERSVSRIIHGESSSDNESESSSESEQVDENADQAKPVTGLDFAQISNDDSVLDADFNSTEGKSLRMQFRISPQSLLTSDGLVIFALSQGLSFDFVYSDKFAWHIAVACKYGISQSELLQDSKQIIFWKIFAKLLGHQGPAPDFEPKIEQTLTSFLQDIDINLLKNLSDIQLRAIRAGLTINEVQANWFTDEHFALAHKWGIYIRQLVGLSIPELQKFADDIQSRVPAYVQSETAETTNEAIPQESHFKLRCV